MAEDSASEGGSPTAHHCVVTCTSAVAILVRTMGVFLRVALLEIQLAGFGKAYGNGLSLALDLAAFPASAGAKRAMLLTAHCAPDALASRLSVSCNLLLPVFDAEMSTSCGHFCTRLKQVV